MKSKIIVLCVAAAGLALVSTDRGSRADVRARAKELQVNKGTRAKNQYDGAIESVAVGYGPIPNSTALGFVRVSGAGGNPQCVIHLATFEAALALGAQIQSDKFVSIHCQDELITGSTVVIGYPPRPGKPSACPKGFECSGQSVELELKP